MTEAAYTGMQIKADSVFVQGKIAYGRSDKLLYWNISFFLFGLDLPSKKYYAFKLTKSSHIKSVTFWWILTFLHTTLFLLKYNCGDMTI